MNIVHIETGRHLYGGAQQVIYLSRGLHERGINSTIVCPPDSAISAAARRENLTVHTISCGGDLDVRFAYQLRSWLRSERPDLVHCHSRRGADILGGRAAKMADVPAVLSRRVDNRESRFFGKLRYSPFEKLIAISDNIAEVLRDSGVHGHRIETIRSAVDSAALARPVSRKQWLHDFDLRDEQVIGVIAAQFIERKGHRFVLDVMPELCRAQPNFRLVLFGKGPLESDLRTRAAELGIVEQVRFAGFRDDLDDLLGCADLLIHPALQEGLGVVMLKAAAAGLPVVAFDVAGAKEAVVAGQTGLLVPAEDRASLLQAMTKLVENRPQRKNLGNAGQVRMRESFSIDEMVDRHISLYEAIVGK